MQPFVTAIISYQLYQHDICAVNFFVLIYVTWNVN
jgi:hypothetical protein